MAETMSSIDNTNGFITEKPYFANLDEGLPESLAPADKSPFRKIEFHPARKPFTGFTNGGGGFRIETLNPTTANSNDARSDQQMGGFDRVCGGSSGKKRDASELENGLDLELSFGITFRRIGAGLENLGNTCFLNSVLQCLTYTEPLAAYLQSGKHQVSCRNAGFCALCAIQKHVSRALQSSGRSLAPKDLVSNLRCISRTFRNSRQEDAHEYMVNLLESMHKCCLPSGVPSESPSAYDRSLVHKIFGGRLRSQVKCLQCNYCSNKFDPFLDLSLEILKADTLYKAFANFTAKEHLDGGAKQYQCQQCKQKVKALKQLTIHKAPNVLTIHLKRFGSHISGQKIDKKVHFSPTLDLKPFVTGPNDEELKYTLYGVLVHAGWSTHSGHYYCFVRTSSGMWYSLDDNHVIQVSERKVFEQKAYMLFYFRDRKNFPSKKPTDVVHQKGIAMNSGGRNNTHPIILNGPKSSNANNAANESQMKESSAQKRILESHIKSSPKAMPQPSVLAENGKDCSTKSNLSVEKNCDILKHDDPIKVESHIDNGAQNSINEKKEPWATMLPERKEGSTNGDLGESTAVTINGSTEKTSSEMIGEISQKVASTEISSLPKMEGSSTKEKSLNRKTHKKSKNFLKCNVKSMKLCSKILMGASLNQRKKKKRKHSKKSKSCVKNHTQEILDVNGVPMDEGPSSSREVNPREEVKHSSDEGPSLKVNSQMKVNIHSVENEFKQRVDKDDAVLATCVEIDSNGQSGRSASEVKGPNGSNDCKRTSKELVHMLTRGLGERTVPRWDDNGSTPSHIRDTQRVLTIGYVGDEWDEEYDRGKKKKVRISRTEFDGKNPFQEIANERLKSKQRQPLKKPQTRRNKHFQMSRSANRPYRI